MNTSSANKTVVRPADSLMGVVALPPDKSVAHRAAIFSAFSEGSSRVVNFPDADDPQSTLACLRALGVETDHEDENLVIHGQGLHGFTAPEAPLDCGNSGTTMRLLSGLLAGQRFDSILTGDDSLRQRPMSRVISPLREMGARFEAINGHSPLTVHGWGPLRSITYLLPVASAQVKSCVLLAGLYADGETTVIETEPSRDHTERMLGLSTLKINGRRHISVQGGTTFKSRTWSIPRDFSAASFFLVAGTVVENSELRLERVGLNPSRAGLIDVLRAMGADIRIENEREVSGEPIGDITVSSAELTGVTVGGELIPNLIDEIPVLCVAAALARGQTVITDAAELRVKETDRLAAMATELATLGVSVDEREDGLTIQGDTGISGGHVDSHGDHRVAMALAIAGLAASGAVTIHGADCTSVSFPNFFEALDSLR